MKTYTLKLTEPQRRAVLDIMAGATVKGASARAFVELMNIFISAAPDAEPPTTQTER
jgi:major membrane immunogen (membrane-anchored lipoprotein)